MTQVIVEMAGQVDSSRHSHVPQIYVSDFHLVILFKRMQIQFNEGNPKNLLAEFYFVKQYSFRCIASDSAKFLHKTGRPQIINVFMSLHL
jgi:hypothetical protein